ncbi:hypothetical protein L7F22_027775 [Adiantum nelumboides]|nr:hypothetical protein [Adiantum nelumboides]
MARSASNEEVRSPSIRYNEVALVGRDALSKNRMQTFVFGDWLLVFQSVQSYHILLGSVHGASKRLDQLSDNKSGASYICLCHIGVHSAGSTCLRVFYLQNNNHCCKMLEEQEVPALTIKFIELVHRALKLEQQAKKEKSRHKSSSDSSISASSESEKSSSSSSDPEEEKKREADQGKLMKCLRRFMRSLA